MDIYGYRNEEKGAVTNATQMKLVVLEVREAPKPPKEGKPHAPAAAGSKSMRDKWLTQ